MFGKGKNEVCAQLLQRGNGGEGGSEEREIGNEKKGRKGSLRNNISP